MTNTECPELPPKGLIHALVLDGVGGAQPLDWKDVSQHTANQNYIWLHFDYSEPETQHWIEHCSGLNEIASEGLLSVETRPHVLTRGENLLIVLRGMNHNAGEDPEDMVSLRIWTDGKRLISTRKRKLLSTEEILADFKLSTGPVSIATLLTDWIDRIVRRMAYTVDIIEENLLDIEDQLFTGEPRVIRTALLQVRKQCIGIRRYIAPQREALNRLIGEPLLWLNDLHRLNLRSIADRQIRHIEDIDEAKERANIAQEELVSRISEQLNNRSYLLTVIAAIFLPLGFFTGLMGINVGGMPGIESDFAFWVVSIICFCLTGLLLGVFYLRKWL